MKVIAVPDVVDDSVGHDIFDSLLLALEKSGAKIFTIFKSFVYRTAAPRWFFAVGNVSLQLLRPSKYLLRKRRGSRNGRRSNEKPIGVRLYAGSFQTMSVGTCLA